jgi:uncharacterized membrane protein YgdD (TMEM256/DUF423 family)
MSPVLVPLAAISAAVAVAASAFGAHGASGKAAEWLRTGGEYQLIHAVAVLVALQLGGRWSAVALLAGSALFAATLYAMALGGPRWLGAITPIGGAAMILGWILLALRR